MELFFTHATLADIIIVFGIIPTLCICITAMVMGDGQEEQPRARAERVIRSRMSYTERRKHDAKHKVH